MTLDDIPSAAPSLARLIQELNKLPGIGPKSGPKIEKNKIFQKKMAPGPFFLNICDFFAKNGIFAHLSK